MTMHLENAVFWTIKRPAHIDVGGGGGDLSFNLGHRIAGNMQILFDC